MSYEVDFVQSEIYADTPSATYDFTWSGFGSDRFYVFNVVPVMSNVKNFKMANFSWEATNDHPPSNLIAHFQYYSGDRGTDYPPYTDIQAQVIGVPSA
jgi:hypothetical protein